MNYDMPYSPIPNNDKQRNIQKKPKKEKYKGKRTIKSERENRLIKRIKKSPKKIK